MRFFLDANIPHSCLGSLKELKDLEFGRLAFSSESNYGIIILRLPSNFKAARFSDVLKDFLSSVDIKELDKCLAIIKLGSYRIRKLR